MSARQRRSKRPPSQQRARGGAAAERPYLLDVTHLKSMPPGPFWLRIACPLLVVLAVFLAFYPALQAGFVDWDDDKVIVTNPHFRGLSEDNRQWMFNAYKMGHYHPLTWLSYSVDYAVCRWREASADPAAQARYADNQGLDPHVFHFFNLLYHAAVAVAFYYLARLLLALVMASRGGGPLSGMSLALGALFATVVFACHPLRVENAVWATERRDVVSALFLVPCLYAYLRYVLVERWSPRKIAYGLIALALLALSLLGKAWGITLPAVMLVLDVWPLRRIGGKAGWLSRRALVAYVEKIPFFLIAIPFAMQARAAQAAALDTMKTLSEWSVPDRVAQASYGLFFYVYKTLLPFQLTPLVPLPVDAERNPFAARFVVAALIVLVVVVLLWIYRKRFPAAAVAAVIYAGVVSPVLGFAQSGPQLVADKYAYIACMPWAVLAGAGLCWVLQRTDDPNGRRRSLAAGTVAIVVCAVLIVLTARQARIWQDSRSLWTHAVAIDPRNVTAHTNLGIIERQAGHREKAIAHYRTALKIDPDDEKLYNNLAVALKQDPAQLDEAIALCRKAVSLMPKLPDLHYTLADALQEAGRLDEAIGPARQAIRLKRGVAKFHRKLGQLYRDAGSDDLAREQFEITLRLEKRLNPNGRGVINALDELGRIHTRLGNTDKAVEYYSALLAIDPNNGPALRAMARLGRS